MATSKADLLTVATNNLNLVDRERYRRSFYRFSVWAFGVLLPGEQFVDGNHIKIICDHLEAVQARHITRLIIAIPPGHMKSLLVSVFWPVWLWIKNPAEQVLSASYASSLSTRDSARSRRIIESPEFQALFGYLILRDDQNAKNRYENDTGGCRLATSVGGTVTGEGGTACIGDDLHKADEATSDPVRTGTIDWFCEAWSSRKRGLQPVEVIVGQRVHERDVSGYCLKERTGYQYLCLPAVCEDDRRCTTYTDDGKEFFHDDRKPGEALWPVMFSEPKMREMAPSDYVWNGQYRQSPSSKGGTIVKEAWFQTWQTLPVPDETYPALPYGFSFVFSSWDLKNKKTATGAYVVGQLWACRWPNVYLIDQKRERWGFIETLDAMRSAIVEWSKLGFACNSHLVEDKANGPSVIEVLSREIPGILPIPVDGGDKIARLIAETPMLQSGCVYIPDRDTTPWVRDFLSELTTFPSSAEKDQVDALSQALAYARKTFSDDLMFS